MIEDSQPIPNYTTYTFFDKVFFVVFVNQFWLDKNLEKICEWLTTNDTGLQITKDTHSIIIPTKELFYSWKLTWDSNHS